MMIKVLLSSANMGDVSEADFDAWAAYVCDHIDDAVGFDVDGVSQLRFGDPDEDRVTGGTLSQRDAIREWLSHEGWDAFCATPEAWPVKPA